LEYVEKKRAVVQVELGSISVTHSSFNCPTSAVAGEVITCTIFTRDVSENPTGSAADIASIQLDAANTQNYLTIFFSSGMFKTSFEATVAGSLDVGIAIGDDALGDTVTIAILSGSVSTQTSSVSCNATSINLGHVLSCEVALRDIFGNLAGDPEIILDSLSGLLSVGETQIASAGFSLKEGNAFGVYTVEFSSATVAGTASIIVYLDSEDNIIGASNFALEVIPDPPSKVVSLLCPENAIIFAPVLCSVKFSDSNGNAAGILVSDVSDISLDVVSKLGGGSIAYTLTPSESVGDFDVEFSSDSIDDVLTISAGTKNSQVLIQKGSVSALNSFIQDAPLTKVDIVAGTLIQFSIHARDDMNEITGGSQDAPAFQLEFKPKEGTVIEGGDTIFDQLATSYLANGVFSVQTRVVRSGSFVATAKYAGSQMDTFDIKVVPDSAVHDNSLVNCPAQGVVDTEVRCAFNIRDVFSNSLSEIPQDRLSVIMRTPAGDLIQDLAVFDMHASEVSFTPSIVLDEYVLYLMLDDSLLVGSEQRIGLTTRAPTVSPSSSPTTSPTEAPSTSPSVAPSTSPTVSPTAGPTMSPTISPTKAPSVKPSFAPTKSPTVFPTEEPTEAPSVSPTVNPTESPTTSPTVAITEFPTLAPSIHPTISPTDTPTASPTIGPTSSPSISPTEAPSISPTTSPTKFPTTFPTIAPSASPSVSPTAAPTTLAPTFSPSTSPSSSPTVSPTLNPTQGPTLSPTMPTASPTVNLAPLVFEPNDQFDVTEPGSAFIDIKWTVAFDQMIDSQDGTATVTLLSPSEGELVFTEGNEAPFIFNGDNFDTPRDVSLRISNDNVARGTRVISVLHQVGLTNRDGSSGSYSQAVLVNVADNDVARIVVNIDGTEPLLAEESGTTSYEVRLSTQPLGPVFIDISSPSGVCSTATVLDWDKVCDSDAQCDGDMWCDTTVSSIGYSPEQLVFTTSNWETPQSVSLTAKDDNYVGPNTREVTISHVVYSEHDEFYNSIQVDELVITLQENDSFEFVVSPSSHLFVVEGSTEAINLRLTSKPRTPVEFSLALAGKDDYPENVNVSSVTVVSIEPEKWEQGINVYVFAEDDDIQGPNEIRKQVWTITSAEAFPDISVEVALVVIDNDLSGVNATASVASGTASYLLEEGDFEHPLEYNLSLLTEPSGSVSVYMVSDRVTLSQKSVDPCTHDSTSEEVDVSQIAFTPEVVYFGASNWSQPQLVLAYASPDGALEGQQEAKVRHVVESATDANYDQVIGKAACDHIKSLAEGEFDGIAGFAIALEEAYTQMRVALQPGTTLLTSNGCPIIDKSEHIPVEISEEKWAEVVSVSEAKFSPSGASIVVSFSKATSRYDCRELLALGISNTCAQDVVKDSTDPFGKTFECMWNDAKTLSIFLGENAKVSPGSYIWLTGGKLNPAKMLGVTMPELAIEVAEPDSKVTPIATLKAPPKVGCGNAEILLDASTSTMGARSSLSWSFSTTSSDTEKNSDIETFLNTADDKFVLFLDGGLLTSGDTYTFTITLTDWLGQESETSSIISKEAASLPTVEIDGPGSYSIKRSQALSLKAIGAFKRCVEEGVVNDAFKFRWFLKEGDLEVIAEETAEIDGVVLSRLKETNSANDRHLTLPSDTLTAGTTYEFVVLMEVLPPTGPALEVSSLVTVSVTQSPLHAIIQGGERRVHGIDKRLRIDGSKSYDPDSVDGTSGLSFVWECYDVVAGGSCLDVSTGGALGLGGETISILSLPLGRLEADRTLRFTMTVSKGDRSSSSTVIIETLEGAPPDVFIEPLACALCEQDDSKVKITATGKLALVGSTTATNSVWSQVDGDLPPAAFGEEATTYFLTPISQPQLALRPNVLTAGVEYTFRLSAWSDFSSTVAWTEVSFVVNAPPNGGLFSVTPPTGEEMTTNFRLECMKWVDDSSDLPLSYRFSKLIGDEETSISGLGTSPFKVTKLSSSTTVVVAYIADILGAEKRITSAVTVSVKNLSEEQVSSEANALVSSLEGGLDDSEAIVDSVALLGEMLNRETSAIGADESRVLRTQLLDIVESSSSTSDLVPEAVDSSAEAVKQLTSDSTTLSVENSLKALTIVSSLTGGVGKQSALPTSTGDKIAGVLSNIAESFSVASEAETNDIIDKVSATVSNLRSAMLSESVAGEEPFVSNQPNLKIAFARRQTSALGKIEVPATDGETISGGQQVDFPTGDQLGLPGDDGGVTDVQVNSFKENPHAAYTKQGDTQPCGGGVASEIVSISLFQDDKEISVNNTSGDICITLPVTTGACASNVRKQCNYFDKVAKTWRSDGCKTTLDESGNVLCCCNHLTDFGVVPEYTVNASTAQYDDFAYDEFNLTPTTETVLDLTRSGVPLATENVQALLTSGDDEVVKLAVLSSTIRTFKANSAYIDSVLSTAVAVNPGLATGVARAAIQTVPEDIETIVNSIVSSPELRAVEGGVSSVIGEAMGMVASDPPASLSLSVVTSYPELRSEVIKAVQSFAKEKKDQTIGPVGGTMLTTGGLELVVPAGALNGNTPLTVHTYDCQYVSMGASGPSDCHAITPHSFQVPIKIKFDVSGDAENIKCLKIHDEADVQSWVEVECTYDKGAGKVTYVSSEFSVLRAMPSTGEYSPVDLPTDGLTTISEVPSDLVNDLGERFERKEDLVTSGKFNEFHNDHNRKEHTYSGELETLAMSSLTIDATGTIYWTNGWRIMKREASGDVSAFIPGAVSLTVHGENLGIDIDDVIDVRLADQSKSCVLAEYVSPKLIRCFVVDDLSGTFKDLVAKKGTKVVNPNTVEVFTHRRGVGNPIPKVHLVKYELRGYLPKVVCVANGGKDLVWYDSSRGLLLTSSTVDPLETILFAKDDVVDISTYSRDGKEWIVFVQGDGVISAFDLSNPGTVELLVAGPAQAVGIAIDDSRKECYVATQVGTIVRVALDGKATNKVVVRSATNVDINGIELYVKLPSAKLRKRGTLYWTESGSNRVMSSQLTGSKQIEVAGRQVGEIVWPHAITVDKSSGALYFSEYLGSIMHVTASKTVEKVVSSKQQLATQTFMAEMRRIQKRGAKLTLN